MMAESHDISGFLAPHGYTGLKAIAQDGSSRRYFRVHKGDQTAILMVAPPEAASPGHKISDFLRIDTWLREIGIAAPEIYAADEAIGFVLMEDFGDVSFKQAIKQGRMPEEVYGLAAHILNQLQAAACPPGLPDYYQSHVHKGHRRILDWYYPAATGRILPDGLAEEYLDVWHGIESKMPPCPQGFLHIDYHAENLMWRSGQPGLAQCGILDFQGAMRGPLPYDLANLLEDARMDVPPDLRAFILSHYDEDYRLWYRVLGTQFHARVIGQFIKLALAGKPQYLGYIPRVHAYLREGLKHPLLKPLQTFLMQAGLDFAANPPVIDLAKIKPLIRPDVF
jgi:aminoglycoside/choline kinase family phosphotransferase